MSKNHNEKFDNTFGGAVYGCLLPLAVMGGFGCICGIISEIIDGGDSTYILGFSIFLLLILAFLSSYFIIRIKRGELSLGMNVKFSGKVSFNPIPCMILTGFAYALISYIFKRSEVETFYQVFAILIASLFGGGLISYFAYKFSDNNLHVWKLWLNSLIAVVIGVPLLCGVLWLIMKIIVNIIYPIFFAYPID